MTTEACDLRAACAGGSILQLSSTRCIVDYRFIVLASALVLGSGSLSAQQPSGAPSPLKRTVLQTHALRSAPGHEGISVLAELAVGGSAPRHTHPGEEFVYVLEGTATFDMAGQPPLAIKPGDAFFIPPNTPHVARNTGKVPLKLLSNYIIPTGRPLASPAP